jgi:hypothetical protein
MGMVWGCGQDAGAGCALGLVKIKGGEECTSGERHCVSRVVTLVVLAHCLVSGILSLRGACVNTLTVASPNAVVLLSLRAQLQLPPSSSKPVPVCTLSPEGVSEHTRCTAVAWVPTTSTSTSFVAAFSSGNIYVYKKVLFMHMRGGGGREELTPVLRVGVIIA